MPGISTGRIDLKRGVIATLSRILITHLVILQAFAYQSFGFIEHGLANAPSNSDLFFQI
jgi:hypothetical protein